jgi:peptide/nickel transport system substrate-binding protein
MKKLVILLLVIAALPLPLLVSAQDGDGGVVVEGNFSGSVNFGSLNPLRNNDTATNRITNLLFPFLVYGNAFTQTFGKAGEEGTPNSLAVDWSVSEDGKVYTFKMRDDAFWSDGTPITATDVKFSFDAIASGVIDSPYYGSINYVEEGNPLGIVEMRVVDDFTVEAVFDQPNCTALNSFGAYPIVPAHVFGYDGSPDFDFSVLVDNDFDTDPAVVYGPFELASFSSGEAIGLRSIDTWAEGDVLPSGYIYRDVPDQTVEVEQFLAGETNFIDSPIMSRRADLRTAANVQVADFPGNAWDYVVFNLADPDNPQPGVDAEGNLIDQGHHPIFGDVRVRRALQYAINVEEIIQGAVFGEGTQMASSIIPTSWAVDPNLAPIPYDPDMAAQLLDEAGWPLGPDGVRICQGCMYAEEGTPFEFELLTNAGNARREAVGVIIQDQLYELGINVDFQAIDWQTLLDTTAGAQTYDAAIMGWREGFPSDPDQIQIFSPSNDDPANQGSNAGSYYNPKFIELAVAANSVPGCAPEDRAKIYAEIQQLLLDDQPYLWLYVQNLMYAANVGVEGFDAYPNLPLWNIQTWRVRTD